MCNTLHKPYWSDPFILWRSENHFCYRSCLEQYLECTFKLLGTYSLCYRKATTIKLIVSERAKSDKDVDWSKAQGQAVSLTLMHLSTCATFFTKSLSSGTCHLPHCGVQAPEGWRLWDSAYSSPGECQGGLPGIIPQCHVHLHRPSTLPSLSKKMSSGYQTQSSPACKTSTVHSEKSYFLLLSKKREKGEWRGRQEERHQKMEGSKLKQWWCRIVKTEW